MSIEQLLTSRALAQTRWSIDIRRGPEGLFAHEAFEPLKTASVAKCSCSMNWPAENPEFRHDVLRTMRAIGSEVLYKLGGTTDR